MAVAPPTCGRRRRPGRRCRRCAHPGNMRGKLVSSADLLIRLLPLMQLLLMRFVFFVASAPRACRASSAPHFPACCSSILGSRHNRFTGSPLLTAGSAAGHLFCRLNGLCSGSGCRHQPDSIGAVPRPLPSRPACGPSRARAP